MRRVPLMVFAVTLVVGSLANSVQASVPATTAGHDARVTRQTYVRHDLGTDPTIQICNSTDPADYGNLTINNEPFSAVDPERPALVISGWNDYCSDWMGLGFSTDGGNTWTNSLVPGYPADTSTEGKLSPEYVRTNNASDPVGAFNRSGTRFYFAFIAYNGFAGKKTNSDLGVAIYRVRSTTDPMYDQYPLDYLRTTRVVKGPSAANFQGKFTDKEMIEVDRTGGSGDGNVYLCWTKFPAFGESTVYFSRSTDHGLTFSRPVAVSKEFAGQGCDVAVEHDGDVYVSWRDFELKSSKKNFGVSVARSSDQGLTWNRPVKVANLPEYTPFDGTRDCGDGVDACPSGFVFGRVPLEPRMTSDPTGALDGLYVVAQASDPRSIVASTSSYSSAGPGLVGRGVITLFRSTDNGRHWSGPYAVTSQTRGHQFFPDVDAYDGVLGVLWQDSRKDPAYSLQRPIGNTAGATSSGDDIVNTYLAASTDGTSFGADLQLSSAGNQMEYEMFDAASVPFYGDYNWLSLVAGPDGSVIGYGTWTDNRDVVPGTDPREETQDGFDVKGCWQTVDGVLVRTCFNGGGYDQNIYGNSVSIG